MTGDKYQPGTGSFISPDPLLKPYDPQNLNAYAYSADNPSTYSDPSGAMLCDPDGKCGSAQALNNYAKAQTGDANPKPKGSSCPPTELTCVVPLPLTSAGRTSYQKPGWVKPAPVTRPQPASKPKNPLQAMGCQSPQMLRLGACPGEINGMIRDLRSSHISGWEILGMVAISFIPLDEILGAVIGRLGLVGNAAEEVVPVLRYPGKTLPQTARNMARYMDDHGLDATSTFTRVAPKVRDAQRAANARLYTGGISMEEFPFASTAEGGPGAYLTQVPLAEQNAQGRLLASFYQRNGIQPGDEFAIWIDWNF